MTIALGVVAEEWLARQTPAMRNSLFAGMAQNVESVWRVDVAEWAATATLSAA